MQCPQELVIDKAPFSSLRFERAQEDLEKLRSQPWPMAQLVGVVSQALEGHVLEGHGLGQDTNVGFWFRLQSGANQCDVSLSH